MSRGTYMGSSEAQALVGKWYQVVGGNPWQQIIGADVVVKPGRGGYQRPWSAPPQYAQPQPQYAQPQYPVQYAPQYPAQYPQMQSYPQYPQGYNQPGYHPHPHHHRHHRHHRVPGPAAYGQMFGHRRTWMGADPTEGSADMQFAPRNALIDAPGPERAGREVLPMSTGVLIDTNQSAQITARPQRVAFRPERVFISAAGTDNGAADWIVNDIKIGNRSQFSQSGDIPGDMFAAVAIDGFVSFETAQTAMDVVMVVTYIGLNEGGCAFYGSIVGTAAI